MIIDESRKQFLRNNVYFKNIDFEYFVVQIK